MVGILNGVGLCVCVRKSDVSVVGFRGQVLG